MKTTRLLLPLALLMLASCCCIKPPDDNGNISNWTAPCSENQNELAENLPKDVLRIQQDELVKRQKRLIEAGQHFVESRVHYRAQNFEDCAHKLIACELALRSVSLSDPCVVEHRDVVEYELAKTYEAWADQLVRQADRSAKVGLYDQAIDKYRKAMNRNPSSSRSYEQRINDTQRLQQRDQFRRETSPRMLLGTARRY
ncbi:MAG: tetratricopeptide (TPR) repeat protein [Rhodothermales bacterium]|jgi:tetratricopeptide (TPR) repeat protein